MGNVVSSWEECIDWNQKALKIDPEFPFAYNNLGLALLNLGRSAEAVEQLRQAVKFRPQDALFHKNLSKALAAEGQYEASLAEYRIARQGSADLAPPDVLATWMRRYDIRD